jgi:DUF1680 family protein
VRGYLHLERTWCSGDRIELSLPMPVERIRAHPAVAEDVGRVALQRGPLIFCLEQADNPLPLHSLLLPRAAELSPRFEPDTLGGVMTVQADALAADWSDWGTALYRPRRTIRVRPQRLLAVPYAVWDNRAPGQMQVWIRETDSDAAA